MVFAPEIEYMYWNVIFQSIVQIKPYAFTIFQLEEMETVLKHIENTSIIILYFFGAFINIPKFFLEDFIPDEQPKTS